MAFGPNTISNIGGAVSDILGGQATARGLRLKAAGSRVEAENYDLASVLAGQNAEFAVVSRKVKEIQTQREIYQGLGTTEADVAGAGFSMSGSALDIMRMGASQGAMTKAFVTEQGLITEAGYREQQQAYKKMAGAALWAASEQEGMAGDASKSGWISGGFKAATAIASLFI